MPTRQSPMIEIRRTRSKGRGVFATQFIPRDTVIEIAPVLVLPAGEVLDDTIESVLSHYVFEWTKKTVAVALGYGSLYNHSYTPNARYEDRPGQIKAYIAVRDIQPGQEVTINYNGDEFSKEPVWFDVVEEPPESSKNRTKGSSRKTTVASARGQKKSTKASATETKSKPQVTTAKTPSAARTTRRNSERNLTPTLANDSKTKARRTSS